MTIHSSDPRDPKRNIVRATDTSNNTAITMTMIAAALVLALGIGWYVMSDSRNTASVLPATTTGQSTERPASMPVNPAPVTPAPVEAPKAK